MNGKSLSIKELLKNSKIEQNKSYYGMKAIETKYNGYLFRSKLEAKWALFFDLLNIKYEYEPEGFESNKNERYLPDFYLPNTYLRNETLKGIYIEIKPSNYNMNHKAQLWFNKPLVMFCGEPLDGFNIYGNYSSDNLYSGYQIYPHWDNCMGIFICGACGNSKIEFAEGNYNNCCVCGGEGNINLVIKAGELSRQHRFWKNG